MRWLTISFALGFIVVAVAGLVGVTYGVGFLMEKHLFVGAGRLTNIVFLMLVFVMIIAALLTLAERKWSAMIQNRIGPNRARLGLPGMKNRSLGGIPHFLADAVKMLTKEDFIPPNVNKTLFVLGPILAFAPVLALFAVIPAGPSIVVDGTNVDMVIATPDFGLLYVLAIASLAVYGTSLGGWSSNNKLALLGGVRASSQMISYEVALGLSLVGMMMVFSTVQLPVLAQGQTAYLWVAHPGGFDIGVPAWGILLQPLGFVLFFTAAFAETKRAPFDLPEAESEIIGYFVEYSGMKFGMYMISEFVEVVVLAGVTVTLFFGGYHLPFGEQWLLSNVFNGHPVLWGIFLGTVFWVKVIVLCWVQLLVRWTFPRFRYDQIQNLGWKILLPIGIANVFVAGALILLDPSLRWLAVLGIVEILFITVLAMRAKKQDLPQHGLHAPHGHGAAAASPAAH